MSNTPSGSKPDLQWTTPIERTPPRRRTGRAWLIVLLIVVALAIVGAMLFLFFGPDRETPTPDASATPTVQPTETDEPTPEPSVSPSPDETTPEPEPTESVVPSPPPPSDPDLEDFAADIAPVLNDAQRGLSIAANSEPGDAAQVVSTLQDDVQRLQERIAPGAISDQWPGALDRYSQSLNALHNVYTNEGDASGALAEARSAATALSTLVGL